VTHRALSWDGCLNVRDLGGLPTEDGAETLFGAVVRADSARTLTDDGWNAAVGYGIRTVLDLRFRRELEADPPRELPVDVVHLSLFGEFDPEYWQELDGRAAAAGTHAASTSLVYSESLVKHQTELADAVRIVADAEPGGVLVHCAGGKDRTGLVSAMLLRLAGVGIDEIAEDYALSERYLAVRREQWLAECETDEERERVLRIAATPAPAMREVLDEVERRYGSVAGYLREGGATDEVLQRARARLRD
jgi:hypothetical protein